jgi:RING finger/CHY zinc finger protein 1
MNPASTPPPEERSESTEQLQSTPEPEVVYGCKHYARKCRIVAPCCFKLFGCRLCHNEECDHEIDRKAIASIECLRCGPGSLQPAGPNCVTCGVEFAQYYCSICKLWDGKGKKKKVYHCEGCGICRLGPQKNYFHCTTCVGCYPVSLQATHKCIAGAMMNNCAVCLDDMFTSTRPVSVLRCGHTLHSHCERQLSQSPFPQCIRCPTCSKTILEDPKPMWRHITEIVATHETPVELRDRIVRILCNDCSEYSESPLNLVAMECRKCESYNTQQV